MIAPASISSRKDSVFAIGCMQCESRARSRAGEFRRDLRHVAVEMYPAVSPREDSSSLSAEALATPVGSGCLSLRLGRVLPWCCRARERWRRGRVARSNVTSGTVDAFLRLTRLF